MSIVIWVVMLYGLLDGYECFGGTITSVFRMNAVTA